MQSTRKRTPLTFLTEFCIRCGYVPEVSNKSSLILVYDFVPSFQGDEFEEDNAPHQKMRAHIEIN